MNDQKSLESKILDIIKKNYGIANVAFVYDNLKATTQNDNLNYIIIRDTLIKLTKYRLKALKTNKKVNTLNEVFYLPDLFNTHVLQGNLLRQIEYFWGRALVLEDEPFIQINDFNRKVLLRLSIFRIIRAQGYKDAISKLILNILIKNKRIFIKEIEYKRMRVIQAVYPNLKYFNSSYFIDLIIRNLVHKIYDINPDLDSKEIINEAFMSFYYYLSEIENMFQENIENIIINKKDIEAIYYYLKEFETEEDMISFIYI